MEYNELDFLQRMGKKPIEKEFQLDNLDDETRNDIWNFYLKNFFKNDLNWTSLVDLIWEHYFHKALDEIPMSVGSKTYNYEYIKNIIKSIFLGNEYYEVYNIVEFTLKYYIGPDKNNIISYLNDKILKINNCAFRFIENKFVSITNEIEINAIEETIQYSHIPNVNLHIKNALEKLSDRENPDYRNSIRESISAVECIVNKINGTESDTLGKALKKVNSEIKIHESLQKGFENIYGYTSDGGIRHSIKDNDNIDFEDAKYMLVSCSAFVNYLVTKANKAGIESK